MIPRRRGHEVRLRSLASLLCFVLLSTSLTLTLSRAVPAKADPPTPPDYVTPVTSLASVDSQGNPAGAGHGGVSATSSISRDGRYVAFNTLSALVSADVNGLNDVYRFDGVTGAIEPVTTAANLACPSGNPNCFMATNPAISADGRYVSYESKANGASRIYQRDMQTGTTTLVSHAYGQPGTPSAGNALTPSTSAGGDFVVSTSAGSDLVAPGTDTNGKTDVFVWTRSTGAIERVSVTSSGGQLSQASMSVSPSPVVSDDGNFVVFTSYANEIGWLYNKWEVFRRDRATGTTTLVSLPTSDASGSYLNESYSGVVDASGGYVAFVSRAKLIFGSTPCPSPATAD